MKEDHNLHLSRKVQKAFKVIKEEFEDTKGAIRIGISKKNRQHNGQMLEDTKGAIIIRISKKNRQQE
jgi:hypothetical protein